MAERQAAKYLNSLGFDYRRTVQYKGTGDSSDITGDLVHLFVEVKDDKSVKVGTKAWRDAYWRAVDDAGGVGAPREAVLLHKERGAWFLTFRHHPHDHLLTATGGVAISRVMDYLDKQRRLWSEARQPLAPPAPLNPRGAELTGLLDQGAKQC